MKSNDRCLSVTLDGDMAMYNCQHCESAGGVRLAPLAEARSPRKDPVSFANTLIEDSLTEGQLQWLERDRGISRKTAEEVGLVSGKAYIRDRGEEARCIGFAYKNHDGTTAVKWRDSAKHFTQQGSCTSLWRIEQWKDGNLIICEGEMDVLAFHEAGVFATSVPNGAPKKLSLVESADVGKKYRYVLDSQLCWERADRVIIAVDADPAGDNLAEEVARRIGKARCWRVRYPEDCKDANDVLLRYGPDALKECLTLATPWPIVGLRSVNEYEGEIMEFLRGGLDRGKKIGVPALDAIFTACPQTMVLITGVPGSGKSTFVKWLTLMLIKVHDWPVAEVSFETPPAVRLLQMASSLKGKPYVGEGKISEDEVREGLAYLNTRYTVIDENDSDISSILDRAHAAILRMGIRVLVIDPYNFLSGAIAGGEEGSHTALNELLKAMKKFAANHGITVWLVAHPTKMRENKDGILPIPTGYDISGGAAFFNVGDVGLTVYRRDDDSVGIRNWKSRHSWQGHLGEATLDFDMKTERYHGRNEFGSEEDLGSTQDPNEFLGFCKPEVVEGGGGLGPSSDDDDPFTV